MFYERQNIFGEDGTTQYDCQCDSGRPWAIHSISCLVSAIPSTASAFP